MKNIQLFCLPFAGGSKYSYREFESRVPSFMELVPLEYPGRGSRIRESFAPDIQALTEDLYRQIKNKIDHNAYAIYGHSMGGLTAFLLVQRLLKEQHAPPVHMFITGTIAPSARSRRALKRHLLPKKEFLEEIKRFDGSPAEILESEELLDYFEPILRNDFRISETYVYEEMQKLNIPLTVITGTEEDMEEDEILEWQSLTSYPVDFRRMPGNHFFIFKYAADIMNIISEKLLSTSKKESI